MHLPQFAQGNPRHGLLQLLQPQLVRLEARAGGGLRDMRHPPPPQFAQGNPRYGLLQLLQPQLLQL